MTTLKNLTAEHTLHLNGADIPLKGAMRNTATFENESGTDLLNFLSTLDTEDNETPQFKLSELAYFIWAYQEPKEYDVDTISSNLFAVMKDEKSMTQTMEDIGQFLTKMLDVRPESQNTSTKQSTTKKKTTTKKQSTK